MMLLRRLLPIAAAFSLAAPTTGIAAPITWQLSGTITASSGNLGAAQLEGQGLVVGTPISFTLSLSETATDICPEDGRALFTGFLPSGTVSVLGATYSGSGAGIEANAQSAGCFGPLSNTVTSYTMRTLWGAPFNSAIFVWGAQADPDIYPFALPPTVDVWLNYICLTCGPDLTASLRTVPEPGTLFLLGTGGSILAARIKRRRRPDQA